MKYSRCSNYDCPLRDNCQLFLNYLEDVRKKEKDEVVLAPNLKYECEHNNFEMYQNAKEND